MRLAVELYGTVIGEVEGGTRPELLTFRASEAGLERFGEGSRILSLALPLSARASRSAIRTHAFFAGLLPEGRALSFLARQAALRERDVIGLLAHYGRDTAGAVQLWDVDDPTEPRQPVTRPVDEQQIGALLRDRVESLGNVTGTGKSLVAGMQPKIVLSRADGAWSLAEGGAPTTHILKPAASDQTPIFREHFGLALARAIGLTRGSAALRDFDGVPTLVIERYDRAAAAPTGRIHQEDLAQVLGIVGDAKYQELGGQASLQRIAQELDPEQLLPLAARVAFTFAINDLDQHAKNVSVLHHIDGRVELSPHYDAVPFAHGSADGRFALAIDGSYADAEVTVQHVVREVERWGVRNGAAIVATTLERLGGALDDVEPDARVPEPLVEAMRSRVRGSLDALAAPGRSPAAARPPRAGRSSKGRFAPKPSAD